MLRPEEEFAAGPYPGAVNIPMDQLEKRLAELPKRKEVVIVAGRTVSASYDAFAAAHEGHESATLAGWLPEWRSAGLPVDVS